MALTDNRESRPWGPTRIALLGYGFATTIGFIHAQAYYGAFGIDILNYVDPIDLLFISLEHIDKVLGTTFFIIPAVLLWVAIGLPISLIVGLALFAIFTSVVSSVLLLFSALIPLGVGAVINTGRALFNRFEWSKNALGATWRDWRDRAQRAKVSKNQEDPSAEESAVRPLRFSVAYRDARESSGPLKPIEMLHYVKRAKKVIGIIPNVLRWFSKVWHDVREKRAPRWREQYFEQSSWHPKPFRVLAPAPRLFLIALLGLLLAHVGLAAWRIGEVEAAKSLPSFVAGEDTDEALGENEDRSTDSDEDGPSENSAWQTTLQWIYKFNSWKATIPWFLRSEPGRAICPVVPKVHCTSLRQPKAVYVIPTANVASLDFPSVFRVSIRHGGREYERGCLAYLGATGSMQFFTDLPYSQAAGDDGCGDELESASPVVVVFSGQGSDVEAEDDAADNGRNEAEVGSDAEQPENTRERERRHEVAGGEVLEVEGPARTPTVERDKEGATSGGRKSDGEWPDAPGGGGSENELTRAYGEGIERPTTNARTVVVVVGDPTYPEHIGEDWLPRCDMKFAAWVGPFAKGAHNVEHEPVEVGACFGGVQRLYVGSAPEGDRSGARELMGWWPDQKREGVRRLVLVGRADREPISNDFHFSNFSLAQSRADWVKERLSAAPEELHVLSIPGGPATPDKVDPCDRIVEIHMCSGPARIAKKDADDGVRESEGRQEAGGGVEEVP